MVLRLHYIPDNAKRHGYPEDQDTPVEEIGARVNNRGPKGPEPDEEDVYAREDIIESAERFWYFPRAPYQTVVSQGLRTGHVRFDTARRATPQEEAADNDV